MPCHSLDPEQAIRRIAEAKGFALEQNVNDMGVQALREIRAKHPRCEYQVLDLGERG